MRYRNMSKKTIKKGIANINCGFRPCWWCSSESCWRISCLQRSWCWRLPAAERWKDAAGPKTGPTHTANASWVREVRSSKKTFPGFGCCCCCLFVVFFLEYSKSWLHDTWTVSMQQTAGSSCCWIGSRTVCDRSLKALLWEWETDGTPAPLDTWQHAHCFWSFISLQVSSFAFEFRHLHRQDLCCTTL